MFRPKKAIVRYSIDADDAQISGETEVRGNLDGRNIAQALAEHNSKLDGIEYSPDQVTIRGIRK